LDFVIIFHFEINQNHDFDKDGTPNRGAYILPGDAP